MSAPQKRVMFGTRGEQTYIFVIVPKASRRNPKPCERWSGGLQVRPLKVSECGELVQRNELSQSTFDSMRQAVDMCGPFDTIEEYYCIFGGLLLDRMYFLVASKIEPALELPFGGVVNRVLETKWVGVSVPKVPKPKVNKKDARRLKDFGLNSYSPGFYYSDDADLSLPFPFVPKLSQCGTNTTPSQSPSLSHASPHSLSSSPELHCDWSHRLREVFKAVGLEASCSVLIRGFVGERCLKLSDDQLLKIQMFGRQDHRNPGPRYIGRGLNGSHNPQNAGAGNDHVYEFVVWKYEDDEADSLHTLSPRPSQASPLREKISRTKIRFARHTVLRGTIPVHWRSEIPAGISEAAMKFDADPKKVTEGSVAYFFGVMANLDHFMKHDHIALVNPAAVTRGPSLRCINMLRQSSHPGEELLSRHFADAVRKTDQEMKRMGTKGNIELAHVDWLNMEKEYGVDVTVGIFWQSVIPFLVDNCVDPSGDAASQSPQHVAPKPFSLTTPQLSRSASPSSGGANDAAAEAIHCSPLVSSGEFTSNGEVSFSTTQKNFVRVNCADSLDRTNLGCFFTCLQAAMEMLALLQVDASSFLDQTPLPKHHEDAKDDNDLLLEPLDVQNEAEFVAHTSPSKSPRGTGRSTNKCRYPFLKSWQSIRDVAACPPAVVKSLAELFVQNGDAVAMMYTNSSALHTNLLRGIAGMKAASSNAVISAQRRYENVFEDYKKMRHLDVLLGRNTELYFPSLSAVFLLRPMPYQNFPYAVIVTGVKRGTLHEEIEVAIKDVWDLEVMALLPPSLHSIDGAALKMHIVVDPGVLEEEALDQDAFIANNSSVIFMEDPAGPASLERRPSGSVASNSARDEDDDEGQQFVMVGADGFIAVVEFDEDVCRVVDVASQLVGKNLRLARNPSVVMGVERYSYPFEPADSSKSITDSAQDVVKKAASSIKSGFKNFVRSLGS